MMTKAAPIAPLFTPGDFARVRLLLDVGGKNPDDLPVALELLRRLAPYAEQLRAQRSALRAGIRAAIVERDGRLRYVLAGGEVLPMPAQVEDAVRAALAGRAVAA